MRRTALLVAASVLVPLATPIVRDSVALAWLPDPLEADVRPVRGLTTFAMFPWAGFLFTGAVLGLVLDRAGDLLRGEEPSLDSDWWRHARVRGLVRVVPAGTPTAIPASGRAARRSSFCARVW